jgi:putative phage-type endonuclease
MDRMAWLEARKLYIGASDIAKLTGVAPASWGGPFSVWADKMQPVTEDEANDLFYWGHRLEPLIAARYGELHGCPVSAFAEDYVTPWPHPDINHVAATPDYLVGSMAAPYTVTLIECKNVSAWMADEWGASGSEAQGNIPEHYLQQAWWQLGCIGARDAVVCALIGGNDWRQYHVSPNAEWFDEWATRADEWFMQYVHGDDVPLPDQRSDIVVGAPAEQGLILTAGDDLDAVLDERGAHKLQEQAASQHVKRLDARIVQAMGDDYEQLNRRDGTVAATHRVGKTGKRRLVVKPITEGG